MVVIGLGNYTIQYLYLSHDHTYKNSVEKFPLLLFNKGKTIRLNYVGYSQILFKLFKLIELMLLHIILTYF